MSSEEILVDSVIRKRNDAVKALYDRYAPALLGLCCRYCASREDAEDVLHEGFMKILKNLPAFRYLGYAQTHDAVRGELTDFFFPKKNLTAARRHNPRQGIEQGRFPRAVGANERYDFPFREMQGNIFNGMDLTVVGVDIFYA